MKVHSFAPLILIILLCLIAYMQSLNGEFVFDDTVAIVKNKDVTKLTTNLSAIFQHDFWGEVLVSNNNSHKSYRPLTTLMFHLEYAYFGFDAKGMKFVNLALHCLNSLLVYQLVKRFTVKESSQMTATIAGSLFALHPVHVETVSGVVGRAELMFCLFYLLSLLLICKEDAVNIPKALIIIFFSCLGILFKETSITIPVASVFTRFMTCQFRDYKSRIYFLPLVQQCKKLLNKLNIILISTTFLLLILRLWIQNFEVPQFKPMDNPVAFSESALTRILSQNYLYALNLWILLCPQWLCFDWALGCIELITNIWDLRLQAVLTLYSFIFLVVKNSGYNQNALLAFGLVILPFLPASGIIIKVGFVIAERVLYVPSIGFCYLVAQSFVDVLQLMRKNWQRMFLKSMLMLLFLCFLLKTRERALEWQTEEKLFQSALKVCPKNAKVHYNIARLASDKSDQNKAIFFYHNAIKLYPEYEAALMNLGNLYRETGDLTNAEKYIKEAIKAFPEFAAAWMNLGILQANRKQFSQALESYEKALKYRKNYAVCYYNLGNLYLDQKQYTAAMQNWQKAVNLNPKQPKAWSNILQMLDNRGLFEDGLRLSEEALKNLPNETSIFFIRANLLGKLQQNIEAEALYKKVLEQQPDNILYNTNFAILYHRWGKYDKAIQFYRKALNINPKQANTAKINLEKLLKRLQQENNKDDLNQLT